MTGITSSMGDDCVHYLAISFILYVTLRFLYDCWENVAVLPAVIFLLWSMLSFIAGSTGSRKITFREASLVVAYYHGHAVARDGQSASENPYEKDTEEWGCWMDGWRDGRTT